MSRNITESGIASREKMGLGAGLLGGVSAESARVAGFRAALRFVPVLPSIVVRHQTNRSGSSLSIYCCCDGPSP